MDGSEVWLVAAIIILAVIMCIYYSKSKHRFTKLLFGALTGVGMLYAAHFLLAAAGITLSANLFTLSVSAILGIPGVVLLVVGIFL